MAHIAVPAKEPGIRGLLAAYPETAVHIGGLADVLLCGPSSLTRGERELIGAYVSSGNECEYCTRSHASTARHLLGERRVVVDEVLCGNQASLDEKMRALLAIAGKVRRDGREVTAEDVAAARAAGADDKAIHDTVLIAAMFCMANRYVEGLGTRTPQDEAVYEASGAYRAAHGYTTTPVAN
jgi:uncharacterized peroxidase-related enzyme